MRADRSAAATLIALAMLGGCTPVEMRGADRGPARPERVCGNAPLGAFVGAPGAPGTIEAARRASGARSVRIVRPGEAVTMDFHPDRLTVLIDAHRMIVRLSCG